MSLAHLRRSVAVVLSTSLLAGALALSPGIARAGDIGERMSTLVRRGDETPSAAIDSIEELGNLETDAIPGLRRMVLTNTGIVAARNGRAAEASSRIDALMGLGKPVDPLAEADAHLVRAELEVNAGHGKLYYEQARAALSGYSALCEAGPGRRADCDYRSWWSALRLAQRGATEQGNLVVAASHTQTMLAVARRFGDRPREAISLGILALQAETDTNAVAADRLMSQAQRLARVDGSPWVEVSVTVMEGMLHSRRQQPEAVQRDYEGALAIANKAGLLRRAMRLRANLSDTYVRLGRPDKALAAIALALPVARQHHDLHIERQLMHNETLAKLALGRLADAKAELTHVLALWERDAGAGDRHQALREFGDALAKAGDAPGAIDLFHREEALAIEIRAANKKAAEAELHGRYDQESQKRRIELLARDNQLKSAELANQTSTRLLWMLAGTALSLMGVLACLMYLRTRELNRTLVRHEALLRGNSERDALTGLANRRQFREVMRLHGGERAFRGALLMVDVDHFKRVNDQHGHAAGDRVLVEVARRLERAMRSGDLVARWGGEEFLVFAPDVDGAQLDQLAERVRVSMNQSPIALADGTRIAITVSIGYAAFPLPASHVPVTWEQAANLADLSLYTAKNHGRNCAVGIVGTTAGTREALRAVEADIASAREDGRVTLRVSPEHEPA